MSLYVFIRTIHASCAVLSLAGFAGRGVLQVRHGQLPRQFLFRVLPHIVDTVLLLTAILLVTLSGQWPFVSPWVTAKLLVLIVYIILGILLMRLPVGVAGRGLLFGGALLCGVYLLLVAVTKNPLPVTL